MPPTSHYNCEKSAHESTEEKRKNTEKNPPTGVAVQRQVAMASGNVPDFDGVVVAAAASDKFAVRRKSNGVDPVIETSEHLKHTGTSKDNQKKTYSSECPVSGHLQTYNLKSLTFISFPSIYLSTKSYLFE